MAVELWTHQSAAAQELLNGGVSALWWEPRVGKTLAAIAGSEYPLNSEAEGDRLIVCPNSVKPTWVQDLGLWGQESYVWGSKPRPVNRPRNVIVNYEALWRSDLLSWNWDTIIFDESQRLQNPRTRLWEHLAEHIQDLCWSRVILLSGTPCPEGWHQLITQSIVATGQFCGYLDPWSALRAGWVYDDQKYRWVIQEGWAAKSKAELQALGSGMTQAEAGINTRKLYRRMPVPAGPHEQKLWAGASAQGLEGAQLGLQAQSCASGRDPETGETLVSNKLNALAEWVLGAARPCVVLCRFKSSLDYLGHRLEALRVGKIHGDDEGSQARGLMIQEFNSGRLDVLLCNIATVKVGLNLSHADTLIFAENSFSGEARIQAEERCTVLGREAIEILDFVTTEPRNPAGTAGHGSGGMQELLGVIDDSILETVREKRDFNTATLKPAKKASRDPGGSR